MKPRSWAPALAAASAILAGCNSTQGSLIPSLPVEIGGVARDGGGPMFFTTQTGWQVEMDQAVLIVGPFYFYNQPSDSNGDQTGTCLIQVTSQSVVNGLDPALYPLDGGASGESGAAVSVDVLLVPPGDSADSPGSPNGGAVPGPSMAALEAYQQLINEAPAFAAEVPFLLNPEVQSALEPSSSAFVAGTATQGSLVVPFYGFLTIDDSTGYNQNDPASTPLSILQSVPEACPCPGGCGAGACSLEFTAQPSMLQIRVDPSQLFNQFDFSAVIPAPSDAGPSWSPDAGPLTWNSSGPDSSANTDLVEDGLRAANGVYLFNLAPP